MRIGHGYDAHRFEPGKPLMLGGVEVASDVGLLAHSDGDVAIHALCDALLGAIGKGDIGQHFPDTNNDFLNIDSRILLREVYELVVQQGYCVGNVDLTIIAQAPKLAPYLAGMSACLAEDLSTEPSQIIETHAVVLLLSNAE